MCKSYTCECTTIYVRRTIFTHLNIQLFKLHVKSFYYLKEKTCKNVDLQHNLKNGQHFFLTFLMTVLVSQFRSIWSFPIKKSRSPINFPPSFFHQTNQTTLPLLHLLPLSSHHSHGQPNLNRHPPLPLPTMADELISNILNLHSFEPTDLQLRDSWRLTQQANQYFSDFFEAEIWNLVGQWLALNPYLFLYWMEYMLILYRHHSIREEERREEEEAKSIILKRKNWVQIHLRFRYWLKRTILKEIIKIKPFVELKKKKKRKFFKTTKVETEQSNMKPP